MDLHLHNSVPIAGHLERFVDPDDRIDAGEQWRDIDRTARQESCRPGEFLVEAEGSVQAEFFGHQPIHVCRNSACR